mgnify:CR=1 FL=1
MIDNLFLIKRGGNPLCCPVCRKRDGKFYQVNETEFRCSHCAEKLYIENIEDEEEQNPIITEEIAMCKCGKSLEYEMKNGKVQFKKVNYCSNCGRKFNWD